jgi:hypothetical protein
MTETAGICSSLNQRPIQTESSHATLCHPDRSGEICSSLNQHPIQTESSHLPFVPARPGERNGGICGFFSPSYGWRIQANLRLPRNSHGQRYCDFSPGCEIAQWNALTN